MEPAKLSRIETLLLEALHRSGPVDLNDRTIPAIAGWLGCTSQILAETKNHLILRGLVTQEPAEISGEGIVIRLTSVGEMLCQSMARNPAFPLRKWWQFWKR